MLILKSIDGRVLGNVFEGGWVTLPNGRAFAPAEAGWTDGIYLLETEPAPPQPTPEEILQQQRAAMQLTFAQLMIGLVAETWITEAEGDAWLAGTLPAATMALIATLPPEQQFPAKARALRPSVVLRLDPMVEALAAAQGKTPEEIDTFFTTYAQA